METGLLDSAQISDDTLCRLMLERHPSTISIQKPAIALRKLKPIIKAALELSNKGGFQAMSLRELSKKSGVSMGGMYAYFDSKQTLLNMILSEVTSAVERLLSTPPEHIADAPIEHLNWFIDAHVRLTEGMLPWFVFAFMEAKNFPKRERRMAIDSEILTESYVFDICARAKAEGLFRQEISELAPSLIKPLLQDWYVKRSKYARKGVSVDDYIDSVQDFVLNACLSAKGREALAASRSNGVAL